MSTKFDEVLEAMNELKEKHEQLQMKISSIEYLESELKTNEVHVKGTLSMESWDDLIATIPNLNNREISKMVEHLKSLIALELVEVENKINYYSSRLSEINL